MAALNPEAQASNSKKIRSRKLGSRVDLTAMVDLAFLLITFFMLTTSLGKPKSMALTLPDRKGEPAKVDENRTLTILVGNDHAKCFMGNQSGSAKEIAVGKDLRRELALRKQQALSYSNDPDKGLIVLIKPDASAHYGNVVDVLDEMAISNIDRYAIVDIDKQESDLLRR